MPQPKTDLPEKLIVMGDAGETLKERRNKELIELIGTFPSDKQAQVLAFVLTQTVPQYFEYEPEIAEALVAAFKRREFILNLKKKIDFVGIEGVFKEMANMNASDQAQLYEFISGGEDYDAYRDDEID